MHKSFSGPTSCGKSVIFFQVFLSKVYVFGAYYLGEVLEEIGNFMGRRDWEVLLG